MREQQINILSDEVLSRADALCFTSNGIVKANDKLVMEIGVTRQFANRFHNLALDAGRIIKQHGNMCQVIRQETIHTYDYSSVFDIIAFPTKQHWKSPSTIELIIKSAHELMRLVEVNKYNNVYLSRPDCANDELNWITQVKPTIASILDDRVIISYL